MSSLRTLCLTGAAATLLGLIASACSSSDAASSPESLGQTRAGATLAAPGFVETTVFSGLNAPTVVRFAADGRVLVAEKGGKIWSYDSLTDTTPTLLLDLAVKVHNFWDRGLLGMTIDPNFPGTPNLYVLYAYDGDPGGASPKWGDTCPTPPGATDDGCVISGRLSRFALNGNNAGAETVLIEGWRQQYPSHSTGQIEFGPDGALYASGGDGASFNFVDYGQDGTPLNPLDDPPVAMGEPQLPPAALGGALRSQSLRRPSGPVLLNGSVIRVDPQTGLGKADNPLAASSDVNAQRIVAYGLRNPFRIATRPGKSEVWIADVGWNEWEELNRIPLGNSEPLNFGWPCYEGAGKQPGYDGADLTSCESLYTLGGHTQPYFSYRHSGGVSANDGCARGSSSVTGIAFYTGASYPAEYQGAMFFADYSRRCIYVMPAGSAGDPDPALARSFSVNASGPVFLTTGPGGDLFYAALSTGSIQRISYLQPVAAFTAQPSSGQVPLIVNFDGSSSTKPLPKDVLDYAWDLDGDGDFNDSDEEKPAFLYDAVGSYGVRLKVTDQRGTSHTSLPLMIEATAEPPLVSTPPQVFIDTPSAALRWRAGEEIAFSGHATDAEDGDLPASALSWQVVIQHCPDGCHIHDLLSFDETASGSFVAEDHDYPMHLELILTATDSSGQKRTARRSLEPSTVSLVFDTQPSHLELVVGPSAQLTPFARRVIAGSENSVSAAATQTFGGVTWKFQSWSDGLPRSHQLPPANTAARYVAVYAPSGGLRGQYFGQLGFAGSALTRIDPVVDFNWGQEPPDASLPANDFSVRWTGEVLADVAQTYQFSTVSDDGVRLYIDGALLIDHFNDHAPATDTASVALTAGWHPIVIEYFDSGGGAQLQLSWSSPSQPQQVVPESHLRPGCDADASCGTGLSCSADDLCLPVCDSNKCKGTKRCRLNGTTSCVFLCNGLSCPQGDVCKGGLCVDACSGVSCASGTHCVSGQCVEDPPLPGSGGAGGVAGQGGEPNGGGEPGGGGVPSGGGEPGGGGVPSGGVPNGGAAPGSGGIGNAAGEPGGGGIPGVGGELGSGGVPSTGGGQPSSGGQPSTGGDANANGGAAPAEGGTPGSPAAGEGGEHESGSNGGSDSGCSCRAAGSPASPVWLWGLAGLLLLGKRRRRS